MSAPTGEVAAAMVIARWVADHMEELARAATDDIWREVAAYRATSLHEDVVDHVVQIFGVFSGTILDSRTPGVEDFAFTAQHAGLRVAHGIGLEDFLRAFRIAQLTLWRHISVHLSETGGDAPSGTAVVEHLMRTIEAGSTAAAMTYLDAQQYSVADQERAARECLELLTSGRQPELPALQATLRSTGLRDGSPFAVVVGRGGSALSDAELISEGRGSIARALPGLIAFWREQLVCLVPLDRLAVAAVGDRLDAIARELSSRGLTVSIGVSAPAADLRVTGVALAEAEAACDHLGRVAGVQLFADLSPLDYLVLHANETALRLIGDDVRDFLVDDQRDGGPLLHSLRVYAEHGLNARRAATALHLHVNTLYYRLAQITERSGCDVRRVDDITGLLLAARLLAGARGAGGTRRAAG